MQVQHPPMRWAIYTDLPCGVFIDECYTETRLENQVADDELDHWLDFGQYTDPTDPHAPF